MQAKRTNKPKDLDRYIRSVGLNKLDLAFSANHLAETIADRMVTDICLRLRELNLTEKQAVFIIQQVLLRTGRL